MRLVSVDIGLSEVKDHISQSGFEVLALHEHIRPVQAVVYSGQPITRNQGRKNVQARNTVLINAAGLTPQEVVAELQDKI
ncbi:MAG: hypothetical protein H6Q67_242 [Firmicutes bacterium]|nr:hypothetical protein [Bacillota bacterium]